MNISLTLRVIPLAALSVAGCSNTSSRQPVKPIATPLTSQQQAEQERAASEQARIESCRQALDSLKEVNPQQATKLSNDFNALVRAASQYNSVREKWRILPGLALTPCISLNPSNCAPISRKR